tara:strand:- start:817 stop:1011 length:195 start_codon:yes stop_codon:yes gene_type:complete
MKTEKELIPQTKTYIEMNKLAIKLSINYGINLSRSDNFNNLDPRWKSIVRRRVFDILGNNIFIQ